MSHKIYAIIGPSGAGKTTLADSVFPKEKQIVSFTSRNPRPGEVEGQDYYFIGPKTPAEIDGLKTDWANGKLVELITYNGNVYGYSTKEVQDKFDPKTSSVGAVVTKEGYDNLKNSIFKDDVVPVFVYASKETVQRHLEKRQDSPENIQKRLALYDQEIKNRAWFNQLPKPKIFIDTNHDNIRLNYRLFLEQMIRIEKEGD